MSFIKYLKERWVTYIFILLAFIFSFAVYKLDERFSIGESNAKYILAGWGILFIIFVALDYGIFNSRIKKFKRYCSLNTSSQDLDEFSYPIDREYAEIVHGLALQYEKYKSDIYTKSSEELEFITKWVHDVKVPIAAVRLILENHEGDIPNSFYQDIDTEIFSIEQSVQRVFYQIKSNTLHDDYKIAKISTKKLIAGALKGYSNFFSYNKINFAITGDVYDVLTDEKWSGYILSEILSNAVKYTPMKGSIVISTSRRENRVTISIKNSGEGISKQDIGQVFNKGYTSSGNRNGMKSTGYGLYLSKKLSDMLGHELTVQSEYGEYAMFSLTFVENKTMHHVTKM
ncbi:sensor histidine kinase [Xylanivirga thermophila]|uniref:sensor histidine kinase n=1 Tax=Xylanivirga thermophila TaxID=2496273 RepID=UPI00101BFF75|nr:sensor histidine kinase [Xylanivirga thermophila]